MISVLRHPVLPVGVVLLVLGIGNWLVSYNKLLEYREGLTSQSAVETVGSLEDFPNLTRRTNDALLARLRRGAVGYSFSAAKVDFYNVVETGGRFFTLVGFLLVTVAVVQGWRESRLARAS